MSDLNMLVRAIRGRRVGADPVPDPEPVGWRDVLTKLNTLLKRNAL